MVQRVGSAMNTLVWRGKGAGASSVPEGHQGEDGALPGELGGLSSISHFC